MEPSPTAASSGATGPLPTEVLREPGHLAAFLGEIPILAASLRVTAACNASCPFCYSNARTRLPDELSLEEWRPIAAELARGGVLRMFITGGEPSLVPWLEELIAEVPPDVVVAMSSNGGGLTHGRLHDLAAAGLKHLQLSVDSVGDSHDRRRGLPGSFTRNLRLLEASDALHRRGLTLCIATLVGAFNLADLEGMLDILADAGCRRWVLVPLCRAGRQSDEGALAPIGAMLRTIERLAARAAEIRGPQVVPLLPPALVPRVGIPHRYRMGYVAPFPLQVAIAANGDLALADVLVDHREHVIGNARRESVIAAARRAIASRAEASAWRTGDAPGICGRCVHVDVCAGGDRALTLLLEGATARPDRMCRAAAAAGLFPRDQLVGRGSGAAPGPVTASTDRTQGRSGFCVVVRHGTCEDNEAGLLPRPASPLTEQGRRDAARVAASLSTASRGAPLRHVVTSPMPRARETAETIARVLRLPLKEDGRLREVDFGAAAGMTPETFGARFPHLVGAAADVANPEFRWPDGERRGDLFERAIAACDEYAADHHGGAIVVTHWTVSGIFIAHLRGELGNWPAHGLDLAQYVVLGADPRTSAAHPGSHGGTHGD